MMGGNNYKSPSPSDAKEQLKAFQEAANADVGLQEKLMAAGHADAVVVIAKAVGFSISPEELQMAHAEISDDELKGIVGGSNEPEAYEFFGLHFSELMRAALWRLMLLSPCNCRGFWGHFSRGLTAVSNACEHSCS